MVKVDKQNVLGMLVNLFNWLDSLANTACEGGQAAVSLALCLYIGPELYPHWKQDMDQEPMLGLNLEQGHQGMEKRGGVRSHWEACEAHAPMGLLQFYHIYLYQLFL